MADVAVAGVPSSGVCAVTGIDSAFMSVPITFTCVGRGGIVVDGGTGTVGAAGVCIRGAGYRAILDGIDHNAATS
jgi:hypothetical protein